jgi:hypothetical protein
MNLFELELFILSDFQEFRVLFLPYSFFQTKCSHENYFYIKHLVWNVLV